MTDPPPIRPLLPPYVLAEPPATAAWMARHCAIDTGNVRPCGAVRPYGQPMRRRQSFVVLTATAALLAGCGSESPDGGSERNDADDTGAPKSSRVVVTAPGGEVVEFTSFSVTCRPSDDEQPPAQIVLALSGFGDAEKPSRPKGPAMIIEAGASSDGTTVKLPHIEEYGKEETFISVFITEAGREREIASNTELSDGEIEVVSASCEPTPHLEMRIDGVMESELSESTVTVQGHVSAG